MKIDRLPLDDATLSRLRKLTDRVARSADPKGEATRLWKNLAPGVRQTIMNVLAAMSTGRRRCMYCEDSQGTDIDHFRPKSTYPTYAFSWPNYLLACAHCNSNHKRNQFPVDGSGNPLLIDPTSDDPATHLAFSPTTGMFTGLDPKGTTTIDVCGLNRDACTTGRRMAWTVMLALVEAYGRLKGAGDYTRAAEILAALVNHPFQSVRAHLARLWRSNRATGAVLGENVVSALTAYPELTADSPS